MSKTIKILIFGALLVAVGCLWGYVCGMIGERYDLIFSPSMSLLYLGLWFFGALVVIAVTGGLVAVLFRAFWVAAVAFALSALGMFLLWEISIVSGICAAVYFLIGLLYVAGVRGEMGSRIRFSVWRVMISQSMLLVVLVAIACTSLYFGYAAEIEREGFSLPEGAVNWVVDIADEYLDTILPEGSLTPEEKEEALDELRATLEGDVSDSVVTYEKYIAVGLAVFAFMILAPVMLILSFVPILLLALLFFILTSTGVVRKVTRTVKVTRLSIEEGERSGRERVRETTTSEQL